MNDNVQFWKQQWHTIKAKQCSFWKNCFESSTRKFSQMCYYESIKMNWIKSTFLLFYNFRLRTSFTIRLRRKPISDGSKLDPKPKIISIETSTRKKFSNSSRSSFPDLSKRKLTDQSFNLKMFKFSTLVQKNEQRRGKRDRP